MPDIGENRMDTVLPWLIPTWQQLVTYKTNNCIPSGMLFCGLQGDKFTLAKHYAQFVLCKNSTTEACGNCRSCVLFNAGNHPDFVIVQPEEKSTTIKIEQIRKLVHFLGQTSLLEGYQVVIITPSEAMNKAAANGLLKTLEEPRGQVLMMLLTHQITAVPATIRSRCHCIRLPHSPETQAENDKLQLRDGLISQLQQISSGTTDPVKVAEESSSYSLQEIFSLLSTLVMDMIRIKSQALTSQLNHIDKLSILSQLCISKTLESLFRYLDAIFDAVKLITSGNNINSQLLLEKLFINWCYCNDIS